MKRLVILGGGFAGVWAAIGAARVLADTGSESAVEITLVSPDPHLVIRPRLYEPDPARFRVPLDPVLAPIGVRRIEARAEAIDPARRTIALGGAVMGREFGREFGWDRLILALGSRLTPPDGQFEGKIHTIDDYERAVALENHIRRLDPTLPGADTALVVGAGFTGIEAAAELAGRFARVVLVDRADVIGPDLGAVPRPTILQALAELDVETRTGVSVAAIGSDHVMFSNGERLAARTIVWCAGPRAHPLAGTLGVPTDALGRVTVDPHLRVVGRPGILAAGDVAHALTDGEHVALMSCQHALRQGAAVGRIAAEDLLGRTPAPYAQPRYVTCLDLGRWGALFTEGWDRQVTLTRGEAKALKRRINGEWIYPPAGDRAAVLKAVDFAR
jgi:NADH dehydrogenase